MKPSVALSVGALAFLGLIFRITPGASSTPKSSPTTSVAEDTKKNKDKKSGEQVVPRLITWQFGPWLSTCSHFGAQLNDLVENPTKKDLASAFPHVDNERGIFPKTFCIPDGVKVEAVVVTVPNPAGTNLGYFTDRALESVIRAFAVPKWEFDSASLPWMRIDEADDKWIERDPQDPEPGVVIFRKKDAICLAFIVGETPSGGIDLLPLKKALRYSRELTDPPAHLPAIPTVSLIGPIFSGSVASLRLAANSLDLKEFSGGPLVDAYSGTVTGDGARTDLEASSHVKFHTATYGTPTLLKGLDSAVLHLGLHPYEVALLIERDTEYADAFYPLIVGEPKERRDRYRVIRFPKDISGLRNAYRELDTVSSSSGTPGRLPFSWHDSIVSGDSIPTFSRSNTLQTHFAMLSSMVEDLRRRTKLVEIVATNVLDALFLASLIRDGAPGTRIVIPDADVLFVRAAREQGLTDILALTPFPVFGLDAISQRRFRTFAGSDAAGVFNAAALYLDVHLRDDGNFKSQPARDEKVTRSVSLKWRKCRGFKSEPSGDYSEVRSTDDGVPPMWLTEATATGYWPIRRFSGTAKDIETIKFSKPRFVLPDPPYSWWVLNVILIAGCTLLALWIIRASKYPEKHLFHFFARPERHQCEECNIYFRTVERQWMLFRQGCLACATASLLSLNIPLCLGASWNPGLIVIAGGAVVAVGALLFVAMNKAEWHIASGWVLIGAAVSWWFVAGPAGRDTQLTALRAIELFSGASPALPVLMLIAGLMAGALVHFRRVSLTFDRNPEIPEGGSDGMPFSQLKIYWEKSCDMWRCQVGFTIWEYGLVVISLCVMVFLIPHMRSVHGVTFSILVSVLAWILLVAILWSATVFYRGWALLRKFLLDLRCLPLNGAFHRLPPEYSTAPIWKGSPNRRNFEVFVRGAECLRELALRSKQKIYGKHIEDLSQDLELQIREIRKHQVDHTNEDYTQISAVPRNAASFIISNILATAWSNGRIDPPGRSRVRKSVDEYTLAAEFVALRYAAAIRYGMMHLRNLIWFISGGFLLLAVALDIADLQSPDVIRWFITSVFVALGFLTVRPMIQMQNDKVLSLMAASETGERNWELLLKLVSYGAAPVVGIVSAYFPSVSRFLLSWLQPTMESLK